MNTSLSRIASWLLAGLLLLVAGRGLSQSTGSLRLTDTIDKGQGNIQLFKNLNASQLEAYRTAHGGKLVFGVDINEAANGSEKASAQAVTVQDAWLEVTMADGSQRVYGHAGGFWTETQALVAPAGSTNRQRYYTLLGESGSSRITANSSIQNIFDSTLRIAVPDSLAGATAAVLRIRLLDANVKLGDPEAFYDYTAGFEDLAILSPADAQYLDTTLASTASFRQEAPAVEISPESVVNTSPEPAPAPPAASLSWVQMPGASSYFLAAYEDLAPARGDYDFNDLVVAYRYQLGINSDGRVERIDGVAYLVARGSTYTHDWKLDLPLPAGAAGSGSCSTQTQGGASLPCSATLDGGMLRWSAFQDTVLALPAPGTAPASPVNTPAGSGFTRGPRATFSIVFATPLALADIGTADPWMQVRASLQNVRLSDRSPEGYPFALLLPSDWALPNERVDMGLAYPKLASYVGSSGAQSLDWYLQPSASEVRNWAVADWAW